MKNDKLSSQETLQINKAIGRIKEVIETGTIENVLYEKGGTEPKRKKVDINEECTAIMHIAALDILVGRGILGLWDRAGNGVGLTLPPDNMLSGNFKMECRKASQEYREDMVAGNDGDNSFKDKFAAAITKEIGRQARRASR